MDSSTCFISALALVAVVGAYCFGLFHGNQLAHEQIRVTGSLFGKLTFRGFLVSGVLPMFWILLYWSFIGHVWFVWGRWPNFGEILPNGSLQLHYHTTTFCSAILVWSLCLVPLGALGCLLSRRWKHITFYCLCHAACVGLAFGTVFLAPGPFLNWLFD